MTNWSLGMWWKQRTEPVVCVCVCSLWAIRWSCSFVIFEKPYISTSSVLVIHKKLFFCSNSEIQKLLGYSMTELKIFHLFILSSYKTLLKLLPIAVCWTLVSCEPTNGVDDQKSTQYLSEWNSKRLRFCVSQGTRICEKKKPTSFFILSITYLSRDLLRDW